MMRRHSWAKKITGSIKVTKPLQHRKGNKVFKVKDVNECQHCGLRRGISTGGSYMRWHSLIYFNQNGEWLSQEKLPYRCTGKQNDFYLTKDDFYVQ